MTESITGLGYAPTTEVPPSAAMPEAQPSFIRPGEIFVNDPSFWQAVDMGFHSGVVLTEEQVRLYREERVKPLDGNSPSDQVLMAGVLQETGGPVDFFREAYPNIFRPRVEKGLVEIPVSRQGSLHGERT